MIYISSENQVLSTIRTGSVYYFNNNEAFLSNIPHYFIVLNSNPKSEEVLFLCVATSQVERKLEYAKKVNFDEDTLVCINKGEYSEFTKDTVVDCNQVFEYNKEKIYDKLEDKKLKMCDDFPKDLVDKIILGLLKSRKVEGYKKDYFKNKY